MTISELIDRLIELAEKHGADTEVVVTEFERDRIDIHDVVYDKMYDEVVVNAADVVHMANAAR